MISTSNPLSAVALGIFFFSFFFLQFVTKKMYSSCGSAFLFVTEGVRMRYASAIMSELDASMVKWLTGSVDKNGKKKRREEQKAAQMMVEDRQNLDDPNRH